MTRVLRRLLFASLYNLGLFPSTASLTDDSTKLLCHTDNTYNYFLYTDEKGWYDAKNECKKDNHQMSTSKYIIGKCIRKIYSDSVGTDIVSVWRKRVSNRCSFVEYHVGTVSYWYTDQCSSWSMKVVCFSEKTTATTTTSTPTQSADTTIVKTSVSSTAATSSIVTFTRLENTTAKFSTSETKLPISTIFAQTTDRTKTWSSSTPMAQREGTTTKKSQPSETSTIGGAIEGIAAGLILVCLVVILAVVLVIKRRGQGKTHKKQNHIKSNIAYGIHPPDVIPSQGSNQNHHTSCCEPQSGILDCGLENGTYYNVQEVYPQSTTYNAAEHAVYDHINTNVRPINADEDNMYSHTDNYTNNEYDHTNFKHQKVEEQVRLEVDNVYSHTDFGTDVEYSNTNYKSETERNSLAIDDTYSHTNGQPSAGQNRNSDELYNHL